MLDPKRAVRTAVTLLVSSLVASQGAAQEPGDQAREVKIAMLLADMTEVDGARQSFTADVFLVASWHDPELAGLADEVISLRDGRMVDPPKRGVPGPGS